MGGVALLDNVGRFDRGGETGPAAAAVELLGRGEQRLAGDDVDVEAGFVVVPEFVAEGRFGGRFLRDGKLRRVQPCNGVGIFAVLMSTRGLSFVFVTAGCRCRTFGGSRWSSVRTTTGDAGVFLRPGGGSAGLQSDCSPNREHRETGEQPRSAPRRGSGPGSSPPSRSAVLVCSPAQTADNRGEGPECHQADTEDVAGRLRRVVGQHVHHRQPGRDESERGPEPRQHRSLGGEGEPGIDRTRGGLWVRRWTIGSARLHHRAWPARTMAPGPDVGGRIGQDHA